MATTYAIDMTGGIAADVAVKALDRAAWSKISEVVDAGTGVHITEYLVPPSDALMEPGRVTLRSEKNPKSGPFGIRRNSVALNTRSRVDYGVDGVDDSVNSASFVIAWNVPATGVEVVDVMDGLMNTFACLWTTLTAKVPDTDLVTAMHYGDTNQLL